MKKMLTFKTILKRNTLSSGKRGGSAMWPGMTLIELMATVIVISLLLLFALPPFRQLQARQAIRSAQKGIQSTLYRSQQLALAPQNVSAPEYDIIGYGIGFHKQATGTGAPSTPVGRCEVPARNDFIAIYKYARIKSTGVIAPYLNADNPLASTCPTLANPERDDTTFFILPRGVTFDTVKSQPTLTPASPWLVPVPLQASGQSFGNLEDYNDSLPFPPTNPLVEGRDNPVLILRHTGVRLRGAFLCHSVEFFRESNGVALSTRIPEAECL